MIMKQNSKNIKKDDRRAKINFQMSKIQNRQWTFGTWSDLEGWVGAKRGVEPSTNNHQETDGGIQGDGASNISDFHTPLGFNHGLPGDQQRTDQRQHFNHSETG